MQNKEILKIGIDIGKIYILLKQEQINLKGIKFDCSIAAYILNPTNNKLKIENLAEQYLEIDVNEEIQNKANQKQEQINLFDQLSSENQEENKSNEKKATYYSYIIYKLQEVMTKQLEEINAIQLFNNIDMPTLEVLANMQWNGMYADENELNKLSIEEHYKFYESQGLNKKEIIKKIAKDRNVNKNEIYQRFI